MSSIKKYISWKSISHFLLVRFTVCRTQNNRSHKLARITAWSLWPNMTCRWCHRAHGQQCCHCRDLFKASTITYRHALSGLVTSARVVRGEEAQLRSRRAAVATDEIREPIRRGLESVLGKTKKTERKRRSVLVNAGLPEPESSHSSEWNFSKWIRNDLETLKKKSVKSTIFWCEIIKIVGLNSVKTAIDLLHCSN